MPPNAAPQSITADQYLEALLRDLAALERMIDEGRFTDRTRRIGAEQELFLVDGRGRPVRLAARALELLDEPRYTHELAQFCLEANLAVRQFKPGCLSALELELVELRECARHALAQLGAQPVYVGILPSLTTGDLGLDAITPKPRYLAMNAALRTQRGEPFRLMVSGIDQIDLRHDNVLLEACTASFQIHFQVHPDEVAELYNCAQLISGPVLAVSCNSPLLFGKRLWKETRIALFDSAVDTRSSVEIARGTRSRVHFGDRWLESSALELYREDLTRFRPLISGEQIADPNLALANHDVPTLDALRLHTGTVYRWNRLCYGITDGAPSLRIEHRALPSGPTMRDQAANAALFYGLMAALSRERIEYARVLDFTEVKRNFFAAARDGYKCQQVWLDGRSHGAARLLMDELIPRAEHGLRSQGFGDDEIGPLFDLLRQRSRSECSGARFLLNRFNRTTGVRSPTQTLAQLTLLLAERSIGEVPVAEWPDHEPLPRNARSLEAEVEELMRIDLITVGPDDPLSLAAQLMDWNGLGHLVVEDPSRRPVGIVSRSKLFGLLLRGEALQTHRVAQWMSTPVHAVSPQTTLRAAIKLMADLKVTVLPVVRDGQLAGAVGSAEVAEFLRELASAEPAA